MALVLNGSGITSANLVNGTIVDEDVADLAASKLTGALPAIDGSALTGNVGKVLQVVSSISGSSFSHSDTALQDIGHSVNITPKSSSSILYLEWTGNISTSGINGMGVSFREGSTLIGAGTSGGISIFNYDDTNVNNTHTNQSMMTSTPSTGTTLRTFKISTRITQGAATNGCKVSGSWAPHFFKITEVAQ